MVHPTTDPARDQTINTMIELTRVSALHRVIVAGSDSLELYLALHRRGFLRVATVTTCRTARGQHSVGLVTGQNSLQALQAALVDISRFLNTTAAIAVLIDSDQKGFSSRIHDSLERLGFRIEAGVRCRQGFVLSAHRRDFAYLANAA